MDPTYSIIEDCSPYYVRFTHNDISKFINLALDILHQQDWSDPIFHNKDLKFSNLKLSDELKHVLLSETPVTKKIPSLYDRPVGYFYSSPGCHYPVHKDGAKSGFNINYTLIISDDKCITNWYSEDDLKTYSMDQEKLKKYPTREIKNFDQTKHIPLKSMIAKPGECILFNTEIWHNWDNSQSSNKRVILTLKSFTDGKTFEDIKKMLFE